MFSAEGAEWLAADRAFALVGMIEQGDPQDYSSEGGPRAEFPLPQNAEERQQPATDVPDPIPEAPREPVVVEEAALPDASSDPASLPAEEVEVDAELAQQDESTKQLGPVLLILLLVFLVFGIWLLSRRSRSGGLLPPITSHSRSSVHERPSRHSSPSAGGNGARDGVVRYSILSSGEAGEISLSPMQQKVGRDGITFNTSLDQILQNDPHISREHFAVWLDAGHLYFRCLSPNGMSVNSERVVQGEKVKLTQGKSFEVQAGGLTLQFQAR